MWKLAISALESEISELKASLFSNEANNFDENRKPTVAGKIPTPYCPHKVLILNISFKN